MPGRSSSGWLTAVAALVAVVAGSWQGRCDEPQSWPTVRAEGLRRHVAVLGSDALQGRAPGSRGGTLAADYIARELERSGAVALGEEGTFFQQVPLVATMPLPECRLELMSFGRAIPLVLGEDYLLSSTGSQTWLPRPVPLVFVGHGIVAPEFDHNDYADVDVRGKIAVYLSGEPASDDPYHFMGDRPSVYALAETKQRIALSRGAAGSVLIPWLPDDAEGDWKQMERQYGFEHLTLAYTIPRHLSLILQPRHARALFEGALFDFEQVLEMMRSRRLRSFHLRVALRFEGVFRTRTFLAPNVVGRIEGRDTRLRDSFVVLSAHYDHLGIGPPVDGDGIYNGVVDNALGVAGVLEMARVLGQEIHRPRRSVIVLLPTAEEAGNLGSSYFLDHPPVPVSKMVANINVDGLAFLEDFEDVVGIGAEYSDLGERLEKVAEGLGLEVSRPSDVRWGHDAYLRSDQAVFAEAGVPALLVNEGFAWRGISRREARERALGWLATVYHTPADDLTQPLNFEAASKHARLLLALTTAVAAAPSPPQWRSRSPYAYRRLLRLADER